MLPSFTYYTHVSFFPYLTTKGKSKTTKNKKGKKQDKNRKNKNHSNIEKNNNNKRKKKYKKKTKLTEEKQKKQKTKPQQKHLQKHHIRKYFSCLTADRFVKRPRCVSTLSASPALAQELLKRCVVVAGRPSHARGHLSTRPVTSLSVCALDI